MIGCIEAGGTKFILGICDELGNIIDRVKIDTRDPEETMEDVIDYFKDKNIKSLGLGCFGPIDLNKSSTTYGYILNTPKFAWKNYNILGRLKEHFSVPIGFDTDVNASVLAEAYYGAIGLKNVLYITIGTGIGAGALVNGELIHGLNHPEMGHLIVKRHPDDIFIGTCPYHHDCLEGLASGKSIKKRYFQSGEEITDESVWQLEAYYLAQALMNYILILSPEIIIIGGGVSKQPLLMEYIREYVLKLLNGYLESKTIIDNIDSYIINPILGDHSGLLGALILGINALKDKK